MSGKTTWFWVSIAAVLLAFIYFFQWHRSPAPPALVPILPELKPEAVVSVQVRPAGPAQLEIRAERTNDTWLLTEPIVYPADPLKVDSLLVLLSKLAPITIIPPSELRNHPNADEEYGFTSPQGSIVINQGSERFHLNLGSRTAPGDQVFLQVVGRGGVYVADADLLKFIPGNVNEWRDTSVVDVEPSVLERISLTNNGKAYVAFELQRDGPQTPWRLSWPFSARADNRRIDGCLKQLQELRVRNFVTDQPKPDLQMYGLTPPAFEVALGRDTNTLAWLQFGKSPTNDAGAVYVRRAGKPTIFTVAKDQLAVWQPESVNDFRDPHLLTVSEPVERILAQGRDAFTLQRQTNGDWRILPEGLPADDALVGKFLFVLSNAPIAQFVKDVVNPPDLPEFGLSPPLCRYVLQSAGTNAAGATNTPMADLSFGVATNQPTKVFARRADETCVYAVSTNDFAQFPQVSWALRERKLWDVPETEVASVTIRAPGQARQLLHSGQYKWSFAPGSQGVLNELAVEETVRGLAHAAVQAWVGRGETNQARFGVTDKSYEIALQFKDGSKRSLRFGSEGPSGTVYAAVLLDGDTWIGEFPRGLYGHLQYALGAP